MRLRASCVIVGTVAFHAQGIEDASADRVRIRLTGEYAEDQSQCLVAVVRVDVLLCTTVARESGA